MALTRTTIYVLSHDRDRDLFVTWFVDKTTADALFRTAIGMFSKTVTVTLFVFETLLIADPRAVGREANAIARPGRAAALRQQRGQADL